MKIKETCSGCGSVFEASTGEGQVSIVQAFFHDDGYDDTGVVTIERQLKEWRKNHKCKAKRGK